MIKLIQYFLCITSRCVKISGICLLPGLKQTSNKHQTKLTIDNLPILPSLLLILLKSEAAIWWCSAKKNFAKFTRKHLLQRLAFNEAADLQSLKLY